MPGRRQNYLYPCRGKSKRGKVIRGDVIAPTAMVARRNFKRSYSHMGIRTIEIGKKREVGTKTRSWPW